MSIFDHLKDNKSYKRVDISEHHDIFTGYYEENSIRTDILKKLSRDLGFSYDLYLNLHGLSYEASDALIDSMVSQTNHKNISLLVNEDTHEIVGYSLDEERTPILNTEFLRRVKSMIDAQDSLSISETHYHPEDSISSVLVKRKEDLVLNIENKKTGDIQVPYSVGILLVNDEDNGAYSRLVMYMKGQPLYLPASYYSATTSRYKRSTSNSLEALELLTLKAIDDLRDGSDLYDKIRGVHYKYSYNKDIVVSYEEFDSLLKAMRKIPSIIDDHSFLESLSNRYNGFEEKYPNIEDDKSSYIWRCTAFSNLTIDTLLSITSSILTELSAPVCEYFRVREILGTYVSTSRIVQEIANESGSVIK